MGRLSCQSSDGTVHHEPISFAIDVGLGLWIRPVCLCSVEMVGKRLCRKREFDFIESLNKTIAFD